MVFNTSIFQCLAAFATGAAFAAVLLSPFIAGISLRIIQTQSLAMLGDFFLAQIGIRRKDLDVLVCSCRHGLRHGIDETRAAVRVNGMVARMIGYHHTFQAVALGDARGDGQHDAVAEGTTVDFMFSSS